MYYVFQLGDFTTRLIATSIKERSLSYDQKWRNQTAMATYAPGGVSQLGARPLPDKAKWKLTGTIMCHELCETADDLFNYIVSIAGRVALPMVTVVPAESTSCCGQRGASRCPYCNTIKYAKWMYAPVVITELKRKAEEKDGEAFHPYFVSVEMTVEIASYLEPLDQAQWRYWYDHQIKYTLHAIHPGVISEQQYHPKNVDWPATRNDRDQGFEFMRYEDYSISPFTDPANWVRGYVNDRPDEQPKAFLLTDDPTLAIDVPANHEFITPMHRWPAPPRSMYYFSDFDMTEDVLGALIGELSITVEKDMPSMMTDTTVATLALSDIDTALVTLGHGRLLASDVIITGMVGFPGGLLLRGGERIEMFVPWDYTGLYPGETQAGWNRVSVEGSDAGEFAACHIFRTI